MKPTSFLARSLKTRVTLFTLAIFLAGIWSLAYYASRMLREDMQRLLGEQQQATLSLVAAQINQGLEMRLGALGRVANTAAPVMLSGSAALQTFLEQRPVLQSLFNGGVIAYQADGTAIAEVPSSAGRVGVNYMEIDTIAAALKEGRSTIGQPVMGKKLLAPVFGMTAPIRNAHGEIVGALAGVTNLGTPNFLDRLTENRYGKSGYYLLEDPQARIIITGTDKSRVMQPLPAPGVNWLIDRHVAGHDDTGITINPLGVEVLASARRVPVAGWYIVAALPTEEAFAPIHDMQLRMLLATLLLTLLAGGLTWWMLRRQLSPMLATAKALADMSDTRRPVQPLPITTQDEIGQLVGGFNRLLDALDQREHQIELVRQQLFHKEKMAAIGSLAASVAHEISNPLSAIVGIAQTMIDEEDERGCRQQGALCHPQLIMDQARRVMEISRQIGELSVPQSQEPDLVDINGLVRSTCNFVRFDRRFRRIELIQNLDKSLPAAYAVADHVVQVLINLLINAADALEGCVGQQATISVSTRPREDALSILISDNGCGIAPEDLEKVFLERYTTKPPGRGTGLGLALCRSLICHGGGDISIESRLGEGTTVTLTLPLRP